MPQPIKALNPEEAKVSIRESGTLQRYQVFME